MIKFSPLSIKKRLLTGQSKQKTPADERSRFAQVTNSLVLHLHPVTVPSSALRFTYTWGLGGISALLVLLLAVTGLMLMFRYDARIEYAYLSIQKLETEIIFGSLVRAVHHWSANLLVITTFLHLLRVFFTASYKQGRTTNWIIGLVLFVLAMAANFTGYLLPWDQLAYWAVTVSTNLMSYIPLIGIELRNFFLGGPQVGQETLSNFYAFHVVFIPALLIILMSYHFWKVRKNGGLTHPPAGEDKRVERLSTIPNLVNIEYAAILVVLTFVVVFSMLQSAPLGPIANPFHSPNPAKAAWYFVGLQELLLHMEPVSALSLVGLMAAALVATPYADRDARDIGVYFRSKVGRRSALLGGLMGLNIVPIMVLLDEYLIDIPGWLPNLPTWLAIGLIPLVLTVLVFVLIYYVLRRSELYQHEKPNHSEALLGVFAFATAGLIMLTIIGNIFRGANMALVLPF